MNLTQTGCTHPVYIDTKHWAARVPDKIQQRKKGTLLGRGKLLKNRVISRPRVAAESLKRSRTLPFALSKLIQWGIFFYWVKK